MRAAKRPKGLSFNRSKAPSALAKRKTPPRGGVFFFASLRQESSRARSLRSSRHRRMGFDALNQPRTFLDSKASVLRASEFARSKSSIASRIQIADEQKQFSAGGVKNYANFRIGTISKRPRTKGCKIFHLDNRKLSAMMHLLQTLPLVWFLVPGSSPWDSSSFGFQFWETS